MCTRLCTSETRCWLRSSSKTHSTKKKKESSLPYGETAEASCFDRKVDLTSSSASLQGLASIFVLCGRHGAEGHRQSATGEEHIFLVCRLGTVTTKGKGGGKL